MERNLLVGPGGRNGMAPHGAAWVVDYFHPQEAYRPPILTNGTIQPFSLDGSPPGMYYIRIISQIKVKTAVVVKSN